MKKRPLTSITILGDFEVHDRLVTNHRASGYESEFLAQRTQCSQSFFPARVADAAYPHASS